MADLAGSNRMVDPTGKDAYAMVFKAGLRASSWIKRAKAVTRSIPDSLYEVFSAF